MSHVEPSIFLRHEEAVGELERLIRSAYELMEDPESCKITHSIRLSVPIESIDPLIWLSAQNEAIKVFWHDRKRSGSVAAVGAATSRTIAPNQSLNVFLDNIEATLNPNFPDLRWYGGLRFDRQYESTARDEHWRPFADGMFILPRFELTTNGPNAQLSCNVLTDGADRGRMYEIIEQLRSLRFHLEPISRGSLRVVSRKLSPNRDGWGTVMAGALDAIEDNAIQKIVLARRIEFEFTDCVDYWSLLRHWQDNDDDSYLWAIQVAEHRCFIGLSPERLYASNNGEVASEAVAGTRPRGATETEDSALRSDLAGSSKDQREFDYVSATVERAMSHVCENVTHDRRASVLALTTLQHLRSEFSGRLREGMRNADILEALHPTPAVGGTPRSDALNLIRRLEPFDRGWYAGPVGWIGPEAAEFAVGIRSGVVNRDRLSLFAGAGIVDGSTIEGEWREIEQKSASLSRTLGIS